MSDSHVGGIIVYYVCGATIRDNTCYENAGPGINVYKENFGYSSTSLVANNVRYDNVDGNAPGNSIRLFLAWNRTVISNGCSGNASAGLRLAVDYDEFTKQNLNRIHPMFLSSQSAAEALVLSWSNGRISRSTGPPQTGSGSQSDRQGEAGEVRIETLEQAGEQQYSHDDEKDPCPCRDNIHVAIQFLEPTADESQCKCSDQKWQT